jgi:pimeloyl-ACP methyl ester carboxylesterase
VATDSSRGFGSVLPAVLLRAARAGYRSVRRFVNDRDHGLYCTVVEELSREIYGDRIGSGLWGLMQGDARDHFTADSAGTLLIDRLRALADEKEEIRLLVVGHSAGSILASHLVRAASELPDNVRIDLVFLAPAIRIDEAARTIAVAGARLANLRIFTMEDKNERIDDLDRSIAGKVYPRSLLYLISGILERREGGGAYADAPLLGMERHLRVLADARLEPEEREARATIARFLDAAPNRIIYSIAEGENGLCTGAKTHGTFDEDTPTLNSIRHIALFGY